MTQLQHSVLALIHGYGERLMGSDGPIFTGKKGVGAFLNYCGFYILGPDERHRFSTVVTPSVAAIGCKHTVRIKFSWAVY